VKETSKGVQQVSSTQDLKQTPSSVKGEEDITDAV